MTETETPETSALVGPDGRPARAAGSQPCPRCAASPKKRVLSAGFGAAHDVCGDCGHDFAERTL